MDDLTFSARRASAAPRHDVPDTRCTVPRAGAIAAARRHPPLSERAARRELRRRIADADVRPAEARRRELRARARRLRRRRADSRATRRATCRAPDAARWPTCSTSFLERRATVSTEDQSPSVQRFREMIGRDEKMLIVFEWIRTAAKSDISVLILGPTGSGKEARRAHDSRAQSRRSVAKFQAVNCAALPDTLFESEIFGYEKGAFTGAHDRKPGRLELANEGTLFLDEIGDMSLIAQAKLLRVLEERRFERLGGNKSICGRLPADLGDQPAARAVRPRRPLPRGPLLPRQRVRDPAAVAARAAGRHSGAGAALPRALLRGAGPAARQQGVLARGARLADAATTGPATSASSRARSRARRCRRRAGRFAPPDIEFLHATRRPRRSPRATACRRSPKPSARTSSACSKRSSGTRRKRRACSTSAAARSTGRSSNTSSSPRPRPAGRRSREGEA